MYSIKEHDIRDYYLELISIQNDETREQFRNGYLGLPMAINLSNAGNKAYRIGFSLKKRNNISNFGSTLCKIE